VRQGEDDMKVRHRQQLRRSRRHPSGACVSLASGAMPVPACNGAITITCLMVSFSLW
jgi:hypothetical protein